MKELKLKEVIIVDDLLKNRLGHFYEYDKSIIEQLNKENISTKLYCNIDVEDSIQKEIEAIPFFAFHLFGYYSKNMVKRNKFLMGKILFFYYFLRDTAKLFKTLNNKKNSLLFFPNLIRIHFLPLCLLLSLYISRLPEVVLVFRSSITDRKGRVSLYYRFCSFLISKNIKSGKIKLASDSEIVAEQIENLLKFEVTVLPIPHIHERTLISEPNKKDEVVRIYMPGEARLEKGFDVLVQAIHILLRKSMAHYFKFYIQNYQFSGSEDASVFSTAVTKLSVLKKECNIKILGNLSSDDYYSCIKMADIILIPYRINSGYDARTSGIFAEAVAAGKPVITTAGTWMDIQLRKGLASGLSIIDGNSESLAHSIEVLSKDLVFYKNLAEEKRIFWRERHNPQYFCRVLFSLIVNNSYIREEQVKVL